MIYLLDEEQLFFPSPHKADPDSGILAIGGDLRPQRLLLGYSHGIFPWYDEEQTPILWHAPNPRMVLFPDQIIVNRSLRKILRRKQYEIKYNTAFSQVLEHCASVSRPNQDGTWLNQRLIKGLEGLHMMGYAHSAEAWSEGRLVGGLYGITIGGVFFGESMFSLESNASKVVFVTLVDHLQSMGYRMIDCQCYTQHLARFGAIEITGDIFYELLLDLSSVRPSRVWPTHRATRSKSS